MTGNRTTSVWILAATIVMSFMVMPIAMLSQSPPVPGGITLVIAPPWAEQGGAAGVVAAAGGQEVGPMRAPFAVLAVLDHPDDVLHLGAWAILDGRVMAMICGVSLSHNNEGSDLA